MQSSRVWDPGKICARLYSRWKATIALNAKAAGSTVNGPLGGQESDNKIFSASSKIDEQMIEARVLDTAAEEIVYIAQSKNFHRSWRRRRPTETWTTRMAAIRRTAVGGPSHIVDAMETSIRTVIETIGWQENHGLNPMAPRSGRVTDAGG